MKKPTAAFVILASLAHGPLVEAGLSVNMREHVEFVGNWESETERVERVRVVLRQGMKIH